MPSAQQQTATIAAAAAPPATSASVDDSSKNNQNAAGIKTPLEQPEYIKQVLSTIEKKVKNLDKRRMKLEKYQDLQKGGETLNEDQQSAVNKYDEVKASLELMKELDKQFVGLANDTVKQLKKQAKKEQLEREESLKERLKEIKKIENCLNLFSNDATVRSDFLNGNRGASQLTQQDLDLLNEFRKLTLTNESLNTNNNKKLENEINDSVEHLTNLVESKAKTVLTTTYSELKKLVDRVISSPYWTTSTTEADKQAVEQAQPQQQQSQEQPEQQQQQPAADQEAIQDIEQKLNVNYQQNTSTDDFVIVSSQEVENVPVEQQQIIQTVTPLQQQQPQQQVGAAQNLVQDPRTFFTTLNAVDTYSHDNNNDGINFLQDSQISQAQEAQQSQVPSYESVVNEQQQQTQQPSQQQGHHQDSTQYVQNNNNQHHGNDFGQNNNQGGNQYGFKPRNNYNDNQNYRHNNNNNGYRRPYNPSDNNERRGGGGGGSRGPYRGGPPGGRGGGSRGGSGGYRGKPRGAPPHQGGYRSNQGGYNQTEVTNDVN